MYAKSRGFTFVEVLIVLAVLGILSTLTVAAFVNFRNVQALRIATQDVHTALIDARTATLASQGDTVHGVHIEETQVVRFTGGTYSSTSPDNIYFTFEDPVTSTSTLSGGGVDIVFTRISGETNTSGTIELTEAGTNASSSITIYASGLIEL